MQQRAATLGAMSTYMFNYRGQFASSVRQGSNASKVSRSLTNHGFKPIVVFTSGNLGPTSDSSDATLDTCFEVWNRRKYPLVYKGILIAYRNAEFKFGTGTDPDTQYIVFANEGVLELDVGPKEEAIPPGERKFYDIAWQIIFGSLNPLEEVPTISVWLYDPIQARQVKCVSRGYTKPGYKKRRLSLSASWPF
jgi:hypothetical protein